MLTSPYEVLEEVRELILRWEALRDKQRKQGFMLLSVATDRCLHELRDVLERRKERPMHGSMC